MEIRKQWLAWVGFLGIIGVAAWLLWAASPRVLAAGHWEAFAKASGQSIPDARVAATPR